MQYRFFIDEVWDYYARNARTLPWREPDADGEFDPYKILVSELMLQQTQVSRVIAKYQQFLSAFPDAQSLANAQLGEVLRLWQGLGYNRRAKFLWLAAQKVVNDFGGVFPDSQKQLTELPGVGWNTAGAICEYAFNQPVAFIETNIRTVYIHHFFDDRTDVDDKELLPIIEATIDKEQPREWYWALMDYGTYLKNHVGNKSRQSKHYTKQSKFEGSRRQIRGGVLRVLSKGQLSAARLAEEIVDERLNSVVQDLETEGLIRKDKDVYRLA